MTKCVWAGPRSLWPPRARSRPFSSMMASSVCFSVTVTPLARHLLVEDVRQERVLLERYDELDPIRRGGLVRTDGGDKQQPEQQEARHVGLPHRGARGRFVPS